MPFVERRDKIVIGIYAQRQGGYAEEFLRDDDAEVVAFLNPPEPEPPRDSLRDELDALKAVLVQKGVVTDDEIRPRRQIARPGQT
jgi:hypothetical protein